MSENALKAWVIVIVSTFVGAGFCIVRIFQAISFNADMNWNYVGGLLVAFATLAGTLAEKKQRKTLICLWLVVAAVGALMGPLGKVFQNSWMLDTHFTILLIGLIFAFLIREIDKVGETVNF